jgi:hypothetical protein
VSRPANASTLADASAVVLVDAHAHIHSCFDPARLLDAAAAHFAIAGAQLAPGAAATGVLLLTESAGDDAFGALSACAGRGPDPALGGWAVTAGADGISLTLQRAGRSVVVVAGRQVACREDLEVLMLGTVQRMDDGRPIAEALERAREWGALRVIPWGAGKWFFARGRLLTELVSQADPADFFLGDEGGRPVFWPTPRHFAIAARYGVRVLPGTDPLPFPDETHRAGGFGAALRGRLDAARPGASLLALLRNRSTVLTPYGGLETPLRFVRHQIGMQLRKRRRKQAARAALAPAGR